MDVRLLQPGDAGLLRALRMQALHDEPHSFGASHAEMADRTEADFAAWIEKAPPGGIFGAFDDGSLVGMAGLLVHSSLKQRHKGMLWGVYVQPTHRGRGLSTALVRAVIDHARGVVSVLQTSVVTGNAVALGVYLRCGFAVMGHEPKALCVDGVYLDEDHLWLDFAGGHA